MVDVVFVQPPYGALERPSIGLGILQAALESTEIDATVWYANLAFAEHLDPDLYYALSISSNEDLLGEWTFSHAAFPGFNPDDSIYLARIEASFARHGLLKRILRDSGLELGELLHDVRDHATRFVADAARHVLSLGPRIVGCTSTFQQHTASLALLRCIKTQDPQVVTMMGGANCEGDMGRATHASFPWVDIVVSGEADELIYPVCRQLLDHGLRQRPGTFPIGVIGPERGMTLGPASHAQLIDMDRSPVPDYDTYYRALESASFSEFVDPVLLIETSRGCWWGMKRHCTFCGLNGNGMKYRAKSAERVVDELQAQSHRYECTRFEAVDNILNLSYVDTALPALGALDTEYQFFFEIKANMQRADLETMVDAGVCWVQPGIESLHDGVLALIGKGCTGLMNVRYLRWARELGIRSVWNFMHDIPGESDDWYAEVAEWIPWIEHLQPPDGFGRMQYHRFSPYHQRPESFGVVIRPMEGYASIYPLAPERIAELAYFFEDDDGSCRKRLSMEEEEVERPGLRQLRSAIRTWRAEWWSNSKVRSSNAKAEPTERPRLSVTQDDDGLEFVDSRHIAVNSSFRLRGLAAEVYRACSTQRPIRSVARMVGESSAHIEGVVDELVGLRILLEVNDEYLGLALQEPIRPMALSLPLGNVDAVRYRRSRSTKSLPDQNSPTVPK